MFVTNIYLITKDFDRCIKIECLSPIKNFYSNIDVGCNKLECLSLILMFFGYHKAFSYIDPITVTLSIIS